ncbi:phosphatase PAP2 family protein [Gordonia sp. PKS22-38]|uniref:Phosphatase PAP2 family protein n=1 Tax=Gordonia prachuapensis TaxID=3115651 RepID=A0ABU7MPI7_9ACTN|nr:phosphatase PAP2 family protein [Gordonia sp. PKS22-38]
MPAAGKTAKERVESGVEPVIDDVAAAAEIDTGPDRKRDLTMVRRIAIGAWVLFVVYQFSVYGMAFDRTRLIILLCLGMLAATIGRRKAISVIVDWLPFALILLLYDWTRDVARIVDMPTQWHLPADVDGWLFGVNPTVWLQSHIKEASPPWWEVITSVIYMSYFIVPYAVAAVLWIKNRATWRRYAACFLATTFLALIGYTLVPAAPPWAAARCTAEQLVDHPRDPVCMATEGAVANGGILGEVTPTNPEAAPYVERISARGWNFLNIHAASTLVEVGQGKANLVAAIPSLHAGLTMLLALFMWPRVKALGKTLFMGYALAMAFTLVYTAEHYVFDILLGWALAGFVIFIVNVVDRKWVIPRNERRRADAAGASEAAEPDLAESVAAESDTTASDMAESDTAPPR